MQINRFIQFKAAFLLVVFALNTMVGFACSVGLDMGFNTTHHKKEETKASVHIHKDGKKHIHGAEGNKSNHHAKKAGTGKDDCCKGKVITLQIADKNIDHTITVINAPVCSMHSLFALPVYNQVTCISQEYVACHFHPPPRNILIAIQRFQI